MTITDLRDDSAPGDSPRMGVSLASLLTDASSLALVPERADATATGFDPLDTVLGGGLRLHDMIVIGGRPGVGKTVAGLQWARSAAMAGTTAVVVSYEHDEATMLGRLFAMEVGMLGIGQGAGDGLSSDVAHVVQRVMNGQWVINDEVGRHPLVRAALSRMETYAHNLVIVSGSTKRTDLAMLEELVAHHATERALLVVDYIQKVPDFSGDHDEQEHIRIVAEGLKQVAIDYPVTVLAIAAATGAGLDRKRVRLEHLRGAQSLGYESDVVMMLNSKWTAVSRKHIAFDPINAEEFKKFVVFTIEKNRTGADGINLEFEKAFSQYRFEPRGRFVSERLIDEGIVTE